MPYPAVPATRIAYDRDGSAGFTINGGITSALSAASLRSLNDETVGTGITIGPTYYTGVIFPRLIDFSAMYVRAHVPWSETFGPVEYSLNTTNGLDGTWVSIPEATRGGNWRNDIRSFTTITGVKSVRFFMNTGHGGFNATAQDVHFYGYPTSADNRVDFWHPTLDQVLKLDDIDFADMVQGTTVTKQFRLRNRSATLTAGNTALTTEVLTDASPALAGQYSFSLDGTNFAATQTIASLGPGATSSVIHLRRTSPGNAALGPWAVRHNAVPATFA